MPKTQHDTFDTLPLSPAMLSNLARLGFASMTPIQAASLPAALAGKDLIAQAQTGSGKTIAFGLALLHQLNMRRFAVQALVLCPTRELADQVATAIRQLARAIDNVKVLTLCGGVALRPQRNSLQNGAHIIVGTPGRVLDHLARGDLDLQALTTLVLDEADRMLDMGFCHDITSLLKQCPAQRQSLLFSATYTPEVLLLAQQFMRQPLRVTITPAPIEHRIEQYFYEVEPQHRLAAVAQLLHHFRPASSLAFCNTKQQCHRLLACLQQQGFSALALHGDLEQRQRDQVLVQFANRSISVLVATDVAARGLDIKELPLVINVDISTAPEVHLHRIGRTARAGENGLALSLVAMHEMAAVAQIEQQQGQPLRWQKLDASKPASTKPLLPEMATLQILAGRKDKIRAGDVLGALTLDAGYQRQQVGKINVTEFGTFVAVQRVIAKEALQKLNASQIKGKSVKVRLL